jgi:phosphatidylserine/phosphatidylglycerophosphate/cardiolipin synthase-like enzyme
VPFGHLVLSLSVGLASPVVDLSSTPATIATCFAPKSDCAAFAIQAIDRAQREILVGAYNLTTGSGIVEALLGAKQRGVDVRLVADKTTPCQRNSAIDWLARAGVPIWIDQAARIAHVKTMVIDNAFTLMGSYNWTAGAARNSENLNLVASPVVGAAYAAHWRERLAVSAPFNRREDWCRAASRTAGQSATEEARP